MGRLDGKVAIITGAAQGMGATHAKLFLEEGAKVVLTDLNEEKGEALAADFGDNALFVRQDVTSEEDWETVMQEAKAKFGTVDVLVNNAGISTARSILDTTLEDYQRFLDINQVSVFLGMKAVIPGMKQLGTGSIINVSSINGIVGGAIGYTDTKFAVRGMTKAAALEVSPFGIRVNSVHPGVIETPMIAQPETKAAIEEFAKFIPLRRIAQPEEVSNLVLFLASEESSYATGAEFLLDGGVTAQ